MRSPAPFYELIGRPAVFLLGFVLFICLGIMVLGLSDPDDLPATYVNAALLSAVGFPMLAGWLFGFVIQELQHTSFAWPLPGVRERLLSGFLISGLCLAAFIALLAVQATSAQSGWLFYTVAGFGGYCIGGVLLDPLRSSFSSLPIVAVLGGIAASQRLADLAAAYPTAALVAALAPAPFALYRLFARSTLQRKPFAPTSPFPGVYMLEKSAEYRRAQRRSERPGAIRWKAGYLGTGTWRWACAAAYEIYGQFTWKGVVRMLNGSVALVVFFALSAWADMGDQSYWQSLARTIHYSVLQSPHAAPAGGHEGADSPAIMVVFLIASLGASLSMLSQSALVWSLPYPVSRRRRAAVVHRSRLIDCALFTAGITLLLSIVGILAGWFAGYEPRFDYLPFFAIPLAGTLIVMPLAQLGGLHLARSVARHEGYTLFPMIIGYAVITAAVVIWTVVTRGLFASPAVGLGISLLLFVAFQAAFRHALGSYFATQDLV